MKRKSKWFKRLALGLGGAGLAVGLIHAVHAATYDRRMEYTEITYSSPKITGALNGYTVAFISDTHAISEADLTAIRDAVNARGVDVVLLGGDYAGTSENTWRTMSVLSACTAPHGVWAAEGNHDSWQKLTGVMEHFGVQPLNNSGFSPAGGLYIGGVQDLWNRSPDVHAATAGAAEGDLVLLVSHNPDYAMQADMSGVDLVLSGHIHGGHVTLFGLLKPLLPGVTSYGSRFGGGWAEGNDGVDVYVSRGAGQVQMAPRVFSRPQVVFLTLKGEGGGGL